MSKQNQAAQAATTATPASAGTPAVINSVTELKAAVASGRARMFLGDETDEARVARVIAAHPEDANAFQRDSASGKLLKAELVDERKFAYLRTCRSGSGVVFVVRTSDAHQTFWARGAKPRGKGASTRSMQVAPADALKGL